ncbi:TetR/AcrR family transcriptional regulator [Jeotgalibaca dankookensis]|uniref:TetR/AcrR family transcriptional regulator n=1 Tax=Jeotgalibaca dankookensis TaxID=708126 RepID=UPI000784580D|nr:TetR family transcriptional regulator [Jeotgalibaca dankookensis]
MPKQTFFNLSKEKRERLLRAAYKEFSKFSLENASINAIIHESDISRGSFYQYFEDKEDLYFYCLHLLKSNEKENVEICFKKENGDLFKGLERTFDYLFDTYFCGKNKEFYHHFFVNMTYRLSRNIYTDAQHTQTVQHYEKNLQDLTAIIDKTKLNFDSNSELQEFIRYTFQMIHWSISRVFLQNLSKEEAKRIVNQQLSWLKNGITK